MAHTMEHQMHGRVLAAVAALLTIGLYSAPVRAQATASVCKDGTTSAATGKGACSGHGGVDAKATSAAKKAEKKAESATKKAEKAEEKAAAQVTCTDGTMSKAGRGACSKHGGVKGSAPVPTATAAPSLPASVPATSPARTKSEAKSKAPSATTTPPATKASSNRGEDNDPTDAIAQCKDGMYSHAANRRGACSRHGGVSKFLKP
jgi:hypothetical protein